MESKKAAVVMMAIRIPGHRRTLCMVMLGLAINLCNAETDGFSEIDRVIEERLRAHLVPGVAVVVMRGDEVLHTFSRGSHAGRLIGPDTPFIIGSLSKLFTATAVMQLVESGRVQLDAPVQQYLPQFRVADEQASRKITVRHLLNQNSGIPGDAPRAAGANSRLQDHVSALARTTLVAPPGSGHVYSSPNYQVLGALVEQVTGQPFGDHLKSSIFHPLGLTHTFTEERDAWAAGLLPGKNIWFGFAGPSAYRFEADRLPTASVITSARDLGRFLAAHLGGGKIGDARILSESSANMMHEGVADGGPFKYAMGLRAGTTAGVSLWHGGALPNYRGAIVLLPGQNTAVVVLTNMSSIFADHPREIAAAIVALMNGRPLPAPFRPLRHIYFAIAAACLILLLVQVRSLVHALRSRRPAAIIPTLLFDLALPLALVISIPKWMKISWRGILESAPDLAVTSGVLILLSLATCAIKMRKVQKRLAAA